MKKNNPSPLDELRREKAILKAECNEREERLSEYWSYINDNIGYLFLDGIVNTFKRKLGLTPSKKQEHHSTIAGEQEDNESSSSGISNMMNTIKVGLRMTYPLVWEMAQPYIWEFAINKIKSTFSFKRKKKKKKKSKDYSDDED